MNGCPPKPEEIKTLRELYPNLSCGKIAKQMRWPLRRVYNQAAKLGLKKDKAFLRNLGLEKLSEAGKATRFVKGHPSWNKGKKIGTHGRSGETQFKKGQVPHNIKHDGAISLRREKTGHTGKKHRWYYWIRVSTSKWEPLHVHLWKNRFGAIPKGMRVMFKDGNSLNCVLENLCLRSPREAMEQTRYSDEYITSLMSQQGSRRYGYRRNKEMYEELLKNPEIIELKRNQLKLQRTIKEAV